MKFILGKEIVAVEVMILIVALVTGAILGWTFKPKTEEASAATVYVDKHGKFVGCQGKVYLEVLFTDEQTTCIGNGAKPGLESMGELPQIQPTWLPFPAVIQSGPFNIPHPSAEIDSPKPRGAF